MHTATLQLHSSFGWNTRSSSLRWAKARYSASFSRLMVAVRRRPTPLKRVSELKVRLSNCCIVTQILKNLDDIQRTEPASFLRRFRVSGSCVIWVQESFQVSGAGVLRGLGGGWWVQKVVFFAPA